MITITVPEWLVWLCIAGFCVQFVLNIALAILTRKNGEASRALTQKLVDLALRK